MPAALVASSRTATLAATRLGHPSPVFRLAIVTALLVVLLQPFTVMAQTQQQIPCVEVDLDAPIPTSSGTPRRGLCHGLGKLRVPTTLPHGLVIPFLAPNVAKVNETSFKATLTNPTPASLDQLFGSTMFSLPGVQGWSRTVADCVPAVTGLQGRWFRALACSTVAQMSNRMCNMQPPRPLLCPKDIKEAWATWQQAFAHPSNSCPPTSLARFEETVAKSSMLRDANANSCFPGSLIESERTCGFVTAAMACANSCRTPGFAKHVAETSGTGISMDEFCRQTMAQAPASGAHSSLAFEPVKFLTEADFKAPAPATGSTGSGNGDGSTNGTPTVSGAFPTATDDTSTVGFMDRPIAGVAGKFWVFGGVGILAIAMILVGVIVVRRRTAASMAAKSRNMKFEESGSVPRGGDFGEKPPALALGTLNSSRVPQQGPTSPTNEYGAYNNTGYNNTPPPHQQHYSNDRKDFFPPSPTQDHFRHPRSPSPPPPHTAHAQGGWQGPHQDAYGSAAPPPPPPPAKESRPETWNKIAQRDSTRPPSMMPRDPVYPRTAILSYMPRLEDELEVHVGDQVAVWEDYADGYAWGETLDGRQGVFPIMCLADPNVPLEQQLPQHPPPIQQQTGGEPLRDMQEGGVRETMVNPQAYRFTQYTVASDMSDDDVAEYRGAGQHQQPPPMPQHAYQQQQQQPQQYAQQPQQQYYGQTQGQGQQRW